MSWKSVGLADEKIKPIKDDESPELSFDEEKIYLTFGLYDVLAKEKITYTHDSIVNLCVVCQIKPNKTYSPFKQYDIINGFLFGAGTCYSDGISGYGVALCQNYYLHKNSGKNARNLVIAGVENKNNVLILG